MTNEQSDASGTRTNNDSARPTWKDWRVWLILAAVIAAPITFNVGPWLHPQQKPINFSPFDPLLGILALLMAWDFLKNARARTWPPLANVLLAVITLGSTLWMDSGGFKNFIRVGVLQTVFMGLFGVWVFQYFLGRIGSTAVLRKMLTALGICSGICFLAALYQYVQKQVLPVQVGGWYSVRGHLGGLVAMMVPSMVILGAMIKTPEVRIGSIVLAVIALSVCLSGGGVIAAVAGCLAIAAMLAVRYRWAATGEEKSVSTSRGGLGVDPDLKSQAGIRFAAAILVGLGLVLTMLLPRLPRDNPSVLWRSLALYAEVPEEALEKPTARLRRYQAVLNLLIDRGQWRLGVGAGQYQQSINQNQYYTPPYPKPSARTDEVEAFDMEADEPYTFGLLETTVTELGIPGLLAIVLVFFTWIGSAASSYLTSNPSDKDRQTLALAALGAGVAALVYAIFGNPLVRGCGGVFAFFMGLSLCLERLSFQSLDSKPEMPLNSDSVQN